MSAASAAFSRSWSAYGAQVSEQAAFPFPTARSSDPHTSAEAAEAVAPANSVLVNAIRVACTLRPLSHEEIADVIVQRYGDRWQRPTIVTACARAGLVEVGVTKNRRGRTVIVWEAVEA